MTRLLIAGGLALLVVLIAWLINRRAVSPPTQPRGNVPSQLDRRDFTRPDSPWLVATFTSDTCDSCDKVLTAVRAVESDEIALQNISFQSARELHRRYAIDSVPTTVVANSEGVVTASWVGAFSTAEMWEAIEAAKS